MSFKQRIWMLPLTAVIVFVVGMATVWAFSSSTSRSIEYLGAVDYPYLGATNKLGAYLDGLSATFQSAVAEGERKRLDEASERAAAMRKVIGDIRGIADKREEAAALALAFDAYFAAASNATELLLGMKQGDQLRAIASMQTAQKALTVRLDKARVDARENFDARLRSARDGVSSVLWSTLVSALVVVAGLGVGSALVIGGVWRQLGGEPEYARDIMRRIAGGDLGLSIQIAKGADNSVLAAIREMAGGLTSIVDEVRGGSGRMRLAAQEIALGNQDLSERTEKQAASLERTTARMHQLTNTVRENADSAHQASDLASTAATVAQRGGQMVAEVVTTMGEINLSSRKIADITSVIDGIAFQTNILALNAAVEAARAGEQGRGFAVVAAEVRSLAQRSAGAAKEIKSLIGASVDKVEQGSKLVQDSGKTMEEIVASVARVAAIIGEITAAAAEQSRGIQQVNADLSQLDEMTQRNAALVEQAAAAAGSMEQQSHSLASAVATFKLDSAVFEA